MQSRDLALLILGAVLLVGVGIGVGSVMAGDVLQDPERPVQVNVTLGGGDDPVALMMSGALRMEPATAAPDVKPLNVTDDLENVETAQTGYVYIDWNAPADADGLVGYQARYGAPGVETPWTWTVEEIVDATTTEWETAATCAATCYAQVGAIYETGIAYADAVEAAPAP